MTAESREEMAARHAAERRHDAQELVTVAAIAAVVLVVAVVASARVDGLATALTTLVVSVLFGLVVGLVSR